MECPICYNIINNSAIGSCCHHFCFICLSKWCLYNNKCPVCKTIINQIIYDKEFDELNARFSSLNNKSQICSKNNISDPSGVLNINILFNDNLDLKFMITLKNNSGPGVYVCKIDNKCRAYYYGVRNNDIILFINNITCYNHKQSINIFDNCNLTSTNMICKILRK
tara:strand:- start:382 stop:879 length:498 start_codon:yes stop_codon:yes gene_type:complete